MQCVGCLRYFLFSCVGWGHKPERDKTETAQLKHDTRSRWRSVDKSFIFLVF